VIIGGMVNPKDQAAMRRLQEALASKS